MPTTYGTGWVGTCGNGEIESPEECDGGDACHDCIRDRTVFLTSIPLDPATLGGVNGTDGADAECNALAKAGDLSGTYKAWLSTPAVAPATTFTQSTGRYVRTDGVKIADSWSDLTDGSLDAPIRWDENGNEHGAVAVWTSTLYNGQWSGDPACGSWADAWEFGSAGGAPFTDKRWSQIPDPNPVGCVQRPLTLYCFEQ